MTLGEFEKLTKDIPKDTRLYWCEQECNVDANYWDIYYLTYQKKHQ